MKTAYATASGLSSFFEPEAIAIIGSFKEGYFGGYVILKSLIKAGFKGRIYPVNPGYSHVLGHDVYPSVKDIPDPVDLVFVMINAPSVPGLIEDCSSLGVKAAVVIADGFAEKDPDGALLQRDLVHRAGKLGIRIIGPNTAGIVNTHNGLNPCPYEAGYYAMKKGGIAVFSQTGMINPQAYPYPEFRFGVSKICDLGNKCDVDECDVLEYLCEDDQTNVISMYLESIRNGKRFLDTSRRVVREKPVLVVKSGRTLEGAGASVSHTGSMAVDDDIFDAVCSQSGLLRLERFSDLFQMPKIFASQPLPRGNRLAILTVTGGVAVMAIDHGSAYGLKPAVLSPKTTAMLNSIFQGAGKMPVDIGPMMAAVKHAFSLYPDILDAVMSDEGVDAVVNIPWANPSGEIVQNYLTAYEKIKGRYSKPLATWLYGPDSSVGKDFAFRLEDMGFPVYHEPETCIQALGLALRYARHRGIADPQSDLD